MGFGILFFGYFLTFAFSISKVYFFADVIGGIVMMYAFNKLSQYNRYYIGAIYSAAAFTLLSLAGAALLAFDADIGNAINMALGILKSISACGMHIFMLLGIRWISSGADCVKLSCKAKRNLVFSVVYYIISIVVVLTSFMYEQYAAYISAWVYIYWWICFILNLVLLYNSFGLLYPADEDQTAKKRSRFKIINYINDKMDKFEENSNKYRRDSMKMAMEEAEKLHTDKKHKKSSKKKKSK